MAAEGPADGSLHSAGILGPAARNARLRSPRRAEIFAKAGRVFDREEGDHSGINARNENSLHYRRFPPDRGIAGVQWPDHPSFQHDDSSCSNCTKRPFQPDRHRPVPIACSGGESGAACGPLRGQDSAQQSEAQAQPQAAPAGTTRTATIPAGTRFALVLANRVFTKSAHPEDDV